MFKWIKDKFKGNKAENIEEIDLKEDIVENIDESIEENTEEVGIDSVDETSNFIAIEDYKEEIEEPTSVDDLNEVLEEVEEKPKFNLFKKLKDGLSKTRQEMTVKINTILGAYVKIDDELLEDLEDILISADIGMETTMKLIDNLRETIIQEKINDPSKVIPLLKEEIKKIMNPDLDSTIETSNQTVILVIGVNGVGKTTTIGKLSSKLKSEGKSVLIAAADTFRAAAIDQLKTWGDRANVDVISHSEGADPAAVIYDGISAAKSRNIDVLICDTAGRLHNKANLMKELEKINKIISRDFSNAKRETLLVLDATTGQNALSQAKLFKEVADITGIVLTKLDGTAKGGVVIALQSELGIPIKLVGVGEKIEDLQKFEMGSFIDAILE
ncbi:signal recognition particle-docking protein FtsY [Peptoniphilus indolicus]|nr:signal recognition particle-docking protein FtsY [Peptoniphilus indolicus]SUB76164.1 Cell division protein FtsY homolog [Peptoniphilus indolicus]